MLNQWLYIYKKKNMDEWLIWTLQGKSSEKKKREEYVRDFNL